MNLSLILSNKANLRRYRGAQHNVYRWVSAVLSGAVCSVALAITKAPDALVAQTAREVQQIVRLDPDIQAGNRQKTLDLVEKKILPHFDFERMTMLAVGREWARASPDQRQAVVAAFRSLLVRTYANALALYKDHKIEVKPVSAQSADNVAVRSQVSAAGGPAIVMDYRMHRTPSGWKVHDVAVEGVSLVTTYRTSFAAEIERGGFDGLIRRLNSKGTAPDAMKSPNTGQQNDR
jgi:phospholipid transport system substrate-binding protein